MQKLKSLAVILLLVFGSSSILYLNSCKKDACEKVTCQNGGVCVNGSCSCTQGYEGKNCETKSIDKYAGKYSGSEYYYLNSSGVVAAQSIIVETMSMNQIKISGMPLYSYNFSGSLDNNANKTIYANVNLNDLTFQIPAQFVDGNIYMGDGAILADNKISWRCSIQETQKTYSIYVTFSGSK